MEIIEDGDTTVHVDTMVYDHVMFYKWKGHPKLQNLDSLLKKHNKKLAKHMKVMQFKLDSLGEIDFDIDCDLKNLDKIEELINNEVLHNIEEHVIALREGGEWEHLIDEEHHRIMEERMKRDEDRYGRHHKRTIIIHDDDDEHPIRIRKRYPHSSRTHVELKPIAIEDINVLKRAGISAKKIMGETLDVGEVKLKVEKMIDGDEENIIVHISCDVEEEGEYNAEVINKEGKVIKSQKSVKERRFEEKLSVDKEEVPYYLILTKNNRLFGRKLDI